MPFIAQGKTNWKFLLIVIVLAVIVGVGMWVYSMMIEEEFEISSVDIFKKTEKDIEELLQIAFLVCEEYELEYHDPNWEAGWKARFAQPGPVYPIAFTGPEKKEVLGLCGPGSFGGYTMMFVLNEEGNIILQNGPKMNALGGGRYFTFDDVTVVDIDGDGIDEIIYKEARWTMGSSESTVHLYASNYEEWIYIKEIVWYSDEEKNWIMDFNYSEALEFPEYHIFKKNLWQIIKGWDFSSRRPHVPLDDESDKIIIKIKDNIEEETADWYIYRNEEYGYKLKYPKDWVLDGRNKEAVILNSPENEKIFKEIEAGKLYSGGYMKDITIKYYSSVSEEPENKFNKLEAITLNELVERNKLIVPLAQITFAGKEAYEVIWGGYGAYYSILIEINNHLYVIQFGNREDGFKLTKIDNLILSTFKFLD